MTSGKFVFKKFRFSTPNIASVAVASSLIFGSIDIPANVAHADGNPALEAG